jgi:hypothetical protein
MVRTKVIPAIRKKMKWATKVRLQTDSAGGHGMGHATGKGKVLAKLQSALKVPTSPIEIEMVVQPGQSPDTNSNDLGFYNSMDASLPPTRPYNLDDLFKLCRQFFNKHPASKLDKIFDAKMSILTKIFENDGANDYN